LPPAFPGGGWQSLKPHLISPFAGEDVAPIDDKPEGQPPSALPGISPARGEIGSFADGVCLLIALGSIRVEVARTRKTA
jgi:hypothetical protein